MTWDEIVSVGSSWGTLTIPKVLDKNAPKVILSFTNQAFNVYKPRTDTEGPIFYDYLWNYQHINGWSFRESDVDTPRQRNDGGSNESHIKYRHKAARNNFGVARQRQCGRRNHHYREGFR